MGREYCICPPKLTTLESSDIPTLVTKSSPWTHRKAVEKLARCFRRELKFDFVPFLAKYGQSADDPTYEAYLFHETQFNLLYEDRDTEIVCGGAACFVNRNEGWVLKWVWFHPYFRGRGLLWKSWTNFRSRYGDFEIERPLSPAMEKFLRKIEGSVT